MALYESLRHRALSFLSGADVTPAPETGAALIAEVQTLRARAAALAPLLPGAAGVGEQALAALVSDEAPVSSLCLVLDRAIRDVRAPRLPRHLCLAAASPTLCCVWGNAQHPIHTLTGPLLGPLLPQHLHGGHRRTKSAASLQGPCAPLSFYCTLSLVDAVPVRLYLLLLLLLPPFLSTFL